MEAPLLDAVWDPLSAAVVTKQADAQQAQVRRRGSCPRVAAVAPARNNAHAPLILSCDMVVCQAAAIRPAAPTSLEPFDPLSWHAAAAAADPLSAATNLLSAAAATQYLPVPQAGPVTNSMLRDGASHGLVASYASYELVASLILVLVAGCCARATGTDVSLSDEVIIMAAAHLGACRGQVLVGPANVAPLPSRSFWYMGLYQLLEENGRKTGNVSSAVIPIMGAQDLLNAGPDACVFLPEMAHPNGCEEWVRALELSQVSTAVVAGFVLAPEVTNKHQINMHSCMQLWDAMPSSGGSRLAVFMNLTFTSLDLAMAEQSVRLQRSVLVALIRARPDGGTENVGVAAHVDACASMCTAVGHEGDEREACQHRCLVTSHADPLVDGFAEVGGKVQLSWRPRRTGMTHREAHAKMLSWVEVVFTSLLLATRADSLTT